MKSRLLIIFGASVVVFVIILLVMTIILNDFKSVTIPSTSDHLSKVEGCILINGDWDSVHKTCDDIDSMSCMWLDGKYQECKSREYKCPLDNPDCTTTLSCYSTCIFEQSLSANVEPDQKELEKENIETEREILQCYGIFNCNVSSQYFESCIGAKKNGVTIEQLCLDSDITIDNGCATIVFPDGTKTVGCHYED